MSDVIGAMLLGAISTVIAMLLIGQARIRPSSSP
jgi:hypothetical protein